MMFLQRRVSTSVGYLQVILSVTIFFVSLYYFKFLWSYLLCCWRLYGEILGTALSYLPGYCTYVLVWRSWVMCCRCVIISAYFQLRLRNTPSSQHLNDPKQELSQEESTKFSSQIYVIRKASYCQPSVI